MNINGVLKTVYFFPAQEPYFLLVAGLFIGLTSGLAFWATLQEQVNKWSKTRSNKDLQELKGIRLKVPFLGISLGVCIFLVAGLETFGFPPSLSYLVAFPLTIFIALLIWFQFTRVLFLLQQGGSKALDLDSI